MVGWGILGCGSVTEKKSGPALARLPGSRLVAVMRRNAAKAADFAARHGALRSYSEADELLRDPEVTAVYVATPPDSHAELAIRAMEAGKLCYVEKPMARSYAEGKRMLECSQRTGMPLYVAYYRRRLPAFLQVRDWLPRLGRLRFALVELVRGGMLSEGWRVEPERAGGGYFTDLGSHQFDLLDYLMGPILEARGTAANQAGLYAAEDIVTAEWRFESGALGTGVWCFTARHEERRDRIEIVGEHGRISFSTFGPDPVRLVTGHGEDVFSPPAIECVQEPLLASVLVGNCPSTGESALRTERVLDAILRR